MALRPRSHTISTMQLSKNWDEVCYPFIHETSWLCDYEVTTDELCALVGSILAHLPSDMTDLQQDLEHLQPLIFHLNGSIRGRLAITESDQQWLLQRMAGYRDALGPRGHAFVLPRGAAPVPQLHQARSCAKKAIRCLVRLEQEGRTFPSVLPRMCNALCNLFFLMACTVNRRREMAETPFISKSYGTHATAPSEPPSMAGDTAG